MKFRSCGRCDALGAEVADLRARLDAAEARADRVADRLLAIADPQALALARAGEGKRSGPMPSFAYDAEANQTTMMVEGHEVPVRVVNGKPYIPIGGTLVPTDEYGSWMDVLAATAAGQRVDGELPPLPEEKPSDG